MFFMATNEVQARDRAYTTAKPGDFTEEDILPEIMKLPGLKKLTLFR